MSRPPLNGVRPARLSDLCCKFRNSARPSLQHCPCGYRERYFVSRATGAGLIVGHNVLKELGMVFITPSDPHFFTEDTPTAILVRQMLVAIAIREGERCRETRVGPQARAEEGVREENRSVRHGRRSLSSLASCGVVG